MRKFTYITLVLLLGSSVLLAQKPSSQEIENNYIKVIIMDKGVKRTVLIPKDDIVKKRMAERFKREGCTARFGIYKDIKKIWEPIEEEHIIIDSNKNVDRQINNFLKQISKK